VRLGIVRMMLPWVLMAGAAAAGCYDGNGGPTAPSPRTAAPAAGTLPVEDVTVLIAESYPAQVVLRVRGTLADLCTEVDQITQKRDGATVSVTITVKRTGDVCAQQIRSTDLNVKLDGGFTSGQYVVTVNGVERRFTI
jgi:archaellum component FlaG (FlaF/FlaG flagellin family)